MNWKRLRNHLQLEGENFACACEDRCHTKDVWLPYFLTMTKDVQAVITHFIQQTPGAAMTTDFGFTPAATAACEAWDEAIEFAAAMARQEV